MSPDLGWAGIFDFSPGSWLATTPDQLEYLASKAVAFDGACSLELAGGDDGLNARLPANGRVLEGSDRMGNWLKANLSLPEAVKAQLREPGMNHELSLDSNGKHWITPVKVHAPFVANPQVVDSLDVSIAPAFAESVFMARVRVLSVSDRIGSAANIDLLAANTSVQWQTGCPADFASKPGQIPTPIPNASLLASMDPSPPPPANWSGKLPAKSLALSLVAPTPEGMGCMRLGFVAGGLNLRRHRPIGLLVHGDASGARLNVQLQDSRGLVHSHFLTISFSGWRRVHLDRFETGPGLFEQRFPRTVFPDDLRGFDGGAVVAANIYLTGATRATVYIGALESLREQPGTTRNATIEIGGAAVGIPDGLSGAPCLPGSNYSHYAPSGGCADYAECEMETGSCRSFGADNAELHLPQRPVAPLARESGRVVGVQFRAESVARVEITVFERSQRRLGPFASA